MHAEFVSCQLARTHYDHLREHASIPHLLVVLVLPEDEASWVEHSAERLILRRCAYWVKMTGMGPADGESKTVRVPRSQVFSPTQLTRILTTISEGRGSEL